MLSSLQTAIEVDLPVVDMSQFPREFDADELNHQYHHHVAAVREACEEYGFFHVVNHGIPTDLLQNVESAARQLFAMPAKVKDRATTSNPIDSYVRRDSFESLCIPNSDSIREISNRIWPEGNPQFCEAFRNHMVHLQTLTQNICKIILASLRLDAKAFYRSDFECCLARLRVNRYLSEGKSIEEEVLFPHTDLDCLTILYQDNVGGLQIRSKEDKWLNVKLVAYSFVVNVADSLKAWTNGRYRSAVHRVVYKGWKERISIGYFVRFPEDKEIWAPTELVDGDHPQRYRPFTYSQFRKEYLGLQERKANYIDEYAGI